MLTQEQLTEKLATKSQEALFQETIARVQNEHYWRDRFAVEEAMAIAGYFPIDRKVIAPNRLSEQIVLSALWPVLAKTKFDCVVKAALGEFPLIDVGFLDLNHLEVWRLTVEGQAVINAKAGLFDDFQTIAKRGGQSNLKTDSSVGPMLRALACYGYVVLCSEGYLLSYGWNGRFEPFVQITPEEAFGLLRFVNGSDEMRRVYDEITRRAKALKKIPA